MGLPILFSWIVGAFFAGGLAYVIGKIALGLRADYSGDSNTTNIGNCYSGYKT